MNEEELDRFAIAVRTTARAFAYPPTPEAGLSQPFRFSPSTAPARFLRRRLAWVAIVVTVTLASLLAVPQARAAVLRMIRIGVVRFFLVGPAQATLGAPLTASPGAGVGSPSVAASPTPSIAPAAALDRIAGETTLDGARSQSSFNIRLPTYPSDLGPPDRVFLQDQGGTVVILGWLDPVDPHDIRLVLHELSSESWGLKKVQMESLSATTVSGQPAVWATGPYLLIYRNGDVVETRLVEGHVLVWERSGITYRLECDLSLEEAVRVAESLQ